MWFAGSNGCFSRRQCVGAWRSGAVFKMLLWLKHLCRFEFSEWQRGRVRKNFGLTVDTKHISTNTIKYLHRLASLVMDYFIHRLVFCGNFNCNCYMIGMALVQSIYIWKAAWLMGNPVLWVMTASVLTKMAFVARNILTMWVVTEGLCSE